MSIALYDFHSILCKIPPPLPLLAEEAAHAVGVQMLGIEDGSGEEVWLALHPVQKMITIQYNRLEKLVPNNF